MKTMTCNQLAGACDMEFHASTFEEMGEMSKNHAMEMAQKGDQAHMSKMDEMMKMPQGDMQAWFTQKQQEFNALPEDR